MTEKIDLLEEIQKVSPFSHILITTFKYSQQFFEKQVFPHFKDKTLPLILVDYKEYQNNALEFGTSKLAGRKYFIESIKHEKKKIFHPKLFLAVNENEIMILIGSNNLTYEGFNKNAELVVPIILDFKTNENLELITDILDFLESILEIIGKQYKNYLTKFIDIIKKYSKKLLKPKDRSSWFLHNIKESFLKRIKDIILEDIQEIFVISPYFSLDRNFYKTVLEFCPKINIIIQQRKNNLPKDILKEFNQINYFQLIIGENDDRFLHSKLILIKTDDSSYYFCTSANFTRPALLSNENIELGLLSKQSLSLDEFISNIGKMKRINLNEIETSELKISDENLGRIDFSIIEAYREGKKIVFVISENIDSLPGEITLYLNNKQKNFKLEKTENILKFKISPEEEGLLSNSIVAKIIIKDGFGEKASDYRVVKNQQIFPERVDFLNSYNIDNANYFFQILEKIFRLPNPSDYISVLVDLIDDDVFIIPEPEIEILKNKKKYSKAKHRKYLLNLSSIINRIQTKHEKRIKNSIKNNVTKLYIETINSFIFTNKAIIWAVLYEKNFPIEELRKIRFNFDMMVKDYINIFVGDKKLNLIINSKLKYHLLILTYIIDKIQSNSIQLKPDTRIGYNPVKQVYEHITISQLYNICKIDNFYFKENVILKLIEEYGQILKEILIVEPKHIINKINIIAKNLSNKKKIYYNMISLDTSNKNI